MIPVDVRWTDWTVRSKRKHQAFRASGLRSWISRGRNLVWRLFRAVANKRCNVNTPICTVYLGIDRSRNLRALGQKLGPVFHHLEILWQELEYFSSGRCRSTDTTHFIFWVGTSILWLLIEVSGWLERLSRRNLWARGWRGNAGSWNFQVSKPDLLERKSFCWHRMPAVCVEDYPICRPRVQFICTVILARYLF